MVLGNHDLHLLAHHFDPTRPLRAGDTLQEVLCATDREPLMAWLLMQPLLIFDAQANDLFVHAGLVPQWSVPQALTLAAETEHTLRTNPKQFLARMYGNKPDRWQEQLEPEDRNRFAINVFTRLRYCTVDGAVNLKLKAAPQQTPPPWLPWYSHPNRASALARIVFGHWSTLGLLRTQQLIALDTGCVWGGALTAVNLDDPEALPLQVRCAACQQPGAD
jgi:bis(5'-nucleosyl)-tetraphosphatase (symmetrical)